jgi:hypothetical protein
MDSKIEPFSKKNIGLGKESTARVFLIPEGNIIINKI